MHAAETFNWKQISDTSIPSCLDQTTSAINKNNNACTSPAVLLKNVPTVNNVEVHVHLW